MLSPSTDAVSSSLKSLFSREAGEDDVAALVEDRFRITPVALAGKRPGAVDQLDGRGHAVELRRVLREFVDERIEFQLRMRQVIGQHGDLARAGSRSSPPRCRARRRSRLPPCPASCSGRW